MDLAQQENKEININDFVSEVKQEQKKEISLVEQVHNELFVHKSRELNGKIPIRPSSIYRFFEEPSRWYREEVLNEPYSFKGNTSTTIGKLVHYLANQYLIHKVINQEIIESAILIQKRNDNTNIDWEDVLNNYIEMFYSLLCDYLINFKLGCQNFTTEQYLIKDIGSSCELRGIIDLLDFDTKTLTEFKTCSKKPTENDLITIKTIYKDQLMLQALLCENEYGFIPETIQVVYIVKPSKKIGARIFKVKEKVTDKHIKDINNKLELIQLSVNSPKEYIPLIFKDMSLFNNEPFQSRL